MTKVRPSCSCRRTSSKRVPSRSLRSSAASGSSSSRSLGRLTSARASATRWRWPPESCAGRRAPKPVEPHQGERLGDARGDLRLRHALARSP